MGSLVNAVESGVVPDVLCRAGIRALLRRRLAVETRAADGSRGRLLADLDASPVALVPERANEQHYELPARFFQLVLGPHLKYSGCYWPPGVQTLARAEEASLALTTERAGVEDGMNILELGCGWGSLTLWMAQRLPSARITAVSNSAPQREYIEARAQSLSLDNVTVITADMNEFDAPQRYDRVVSVEMFEHMRNYRLLLRRIRGWLEDDGRLFVHIFCHRRLAYPFEIRGAGDWMARHFFTGGIMPSFDLLRAFDDDMRMEADWWIDGSHYARTAGAWLRQLDGNRDEVAEVLAGTYGVESSRRWLVRWRLFFMACEELFGFRDGAEWGVGHYIFRGG